MSSNVQGITAGRIGNHLAVLLLVTLWTIPTFGLFVSAFRSAEQIELSGWWTALTSQEVQDTIRLPSLSDAVEEGGQYVLRGDLIPDGTPDRIAGFSTSPRVFDEFGPGDTGEFRDGTRITIQEDGAFELVSAEPLEGRSPRVRVLRAQPPQFSLANFQQVLGGENMFRAFINSATVTIPATIIPISIAAFAAYALSWMTFPGRNLLLVIIVALLVVPLQMSLIPLLQLYNGFAQVTGGESRSYPGIWLAHTAFGLPLAIYLLRNYMVGLPREIMESARMDGATHFQIFTRLALPLSLPALASFAIFQFLWVWNDLLVALVFLGKAPDKIVLQSAIIEQLGTYGGEWGILSASAFVTIIVPLVVFLSLQRYFVRGLLAGSVK